LPKRIQGQPIGPQAFRNAFKLETAWQNLVAARSRLGQAGVALREISQP
jgi:hypothetical protein